MYLYVTFLKLQVKWNAVLSKWVTGSDDGSVRIWVMLKTVVMKLTYGHIYHSFLITTSVMSFIFSES